MEVPHSSESINKLRHGFITGRIVLTATARDLFGLLASRPLMVKEVVVAVSGKNNIVCVALQG